MVCQAAALMAECNCTDPADVKRTLNNVRHKRQGALAIAGPVVLVRAVLLGPDLQQLLDLLVLE